MRAIATAAGVATGNAYYYFPSKQHLIQHTTREPRRARGRPPGHLDSTTSLTRRIAGVLRVRHRRADAVPCVRLVVDQDVASRPAR